MNRIFPRPIVSLLMPLALVFHAGGCAIPYKVAVNDVGAPQYKRVDITYRIPANHRALAQNASGIVGASGEFDTPIANSRSNAALRIEYPHPQHQPEMVRATLRLSGKPPRAASRSFIGRLRSNMSWLPGSQSPSKVSPSLDDEVWVLDFPRQQLDLMLVDLANSGFFDDQKRHEGTAFLSVTIDRGGMSKTWSPEARLDDVVLRVQREGWRTSADAVRTADRRK